MTYLAAALIAAPVTLSGIIAMLKARTEVKQFLTSLHDRDSALLGDVGAATLPGCAHELRFTQSLLALSRARSLKPCDSPEPALDEFSSLALVRHAQLKTHDRVA